MQLATKSALGGFIAGIIAIPTVMILAHFYETWAYIILWPTTILGFDYNGEIPSWVLALAEFSSNALIYGLAGWMIGLAVQRAGKTRKRSGHHRRRIAGTS